MIDNSLRVLDSIDQGKKLAEFKFKVLESQTQSSIRTCFPTAEGAASHDIHPLASTTDLTSIEDDEEPEVLVIPSSP